MLMRCSSTALLIALAALAAPAAASAADLYVDAGPAGSDANPCAQASPCATIGHAVTLASASGDTIHIAAGTYPESITLDKDIDLVGAGSGTPGSAAGSTFIHPTAGDGALTFHSGGSLRNVRVRGVDGDGVSTAAVYMQHFDAGTFDYSLQNVVAIGGQDTVAGVSATALYAGAVYGPYSSVSIDIGNSTLSSALTGGDGAMFHAPAGTLDVTIHDSTLSPGPEASGIDALHHTSLSLIDSKIKGNTLTLGVESQGPLTITRSTISGVDVGIIWTASGAAFSLLDSLVATNPAGPNQAAVGLNVPGSISLSPPGHSSALIRGSTIVTSTSANNQDGVGITSGDNSSMTASLVNSVIRVRKADGSASNGDEITTAVVPDGEIDLTASHSSYNTISEGPGTTIPAPGSGTNISGNPGLSSFANGRYTLAADSALIDRGDPGVVTSGETDLVGAPRSLDGNSDCASAPDPGAYELTGREGTAPSVAISAPALARRNENVTFSTLPHQDFTYTWAFSDGGTATGDSVVHRFSADGTQSATLTATQGSCSGSLTRSLKVDGVPPKIHGIAIDGRILRFRSSEQAKTTVAFLRRSTRGKYRGIGELSVSARQGKNSKRLPRRLDGHRLRRGRYLLKLRATDAAGNHSRVASKHARIR